MSKRDESRRLGPVEVLVVVFVCVFALGAVAPALLRSRADNFRMQCAKNLSQIGKAMLIYANDYDDAFPRTGGKNCMWDRDIPNWMAPSRFTAYGMAADGEGGRASISSCFYLLVKYAELMPKTFVCPGDSGTTVFNLRDVDAGGRGLIDLWDFGPEAYRHCSYSYHMPSGLYALKMSSEPGMAVAADRNPWMDSPGARAKNMRLFVPEGERAAVKAGNALAHEEEGQNVLIVDGHVSFEDHPYCGIDDDNIYTHWDGGDIRRGAVPTYGSSPQHIADSFLVHDPQVPRVTVTAKRPKTLRSADLTKTAVVATLDCPMPEHKNVIWCATFQMAWDKLAEDVIGGSVNVVGAEDLAARLNQARFDPKNLKDQAFYAAAGIVKYGIIDRIQKEMAGRFPSQSKPLLDRLDALRHQIPEDSIVACSFLGLGIDFEHDFYVNKRAFEFRDSNGESTDVTSFREHAGPDSSKSVREQVDVLYFRDFDKVGSVDFVVDLSRSTEPYQVVLARMRRRDTLAQSLATVEEKISEFEADPDYELLRNLKGIDRLIVPDVLYELPHHFEELEGKNLANPGWSIYFILDAIQMIDFKLSRTGVILRSESLITATSLAMERRQIIEPRHFDFDRPFLIYVKKRGSDYSPFFVMWVDNAELMQGSSSSG